MKHNINDWPQISGSIKINPYPGVETNINVTKLSPKWIMTIGSLLVAYGLYLYLNKEKKETNS